MLKAEKQIRETICEHNLIERGDHIVIGLSGGPDSMCLFHVLLKLKEEMELTIHPVHVNHQFRPGAAEADQDYVERFCVQAGLKPHVFTVDCNGLAEQLGMTSEEAGRKARYDAFWKVAAEVASTCSGEGAVCGSPLRSSVKIAVGHNADDQAETVLFRILRGTGMDGLAGMAYMREEKRSGIEGAPGGAFRVIRPLLDVRREDIEEYCSAQGLQPVTDHTNNEELYTRNKIRLDLIPYIEEKYNTNFREGLIRMAKIAASDKAYFWEETAQAYGRLRMPAASKSEADPETDAAIVLDWRGLAECHEALRHRIVLKAFGEIGLTQDITAERLAAADKIILGKTGGKIVEFPHGYLLRVGKGTVRFLLMKV